MSGADPKAAKIIKTPTAAWEAARGLILSDPERARRDQAFVSGLGLRPVADNLVDFMPAALGRLEAAKTKETNARQEVEALAKANYLAKSQTHAMVIDLLEARNNSDLARKVQEGAENRFGLCAGRLAVEGPNGVPMGWQALPSGMADLIFGETAMVRMGEPVALVDIFGPLAVEVSSVALVRMALWSPLRQGILAFGSSEPDGFTKDMGAELIAFIARVVERTAERWPPVV